MKELLRINQPEKPVPSQFSGPDPDPDIGDGLLVAMRADAQIQDQIRDFYRKGISLTAINHTDIDQIFSIKRKHFPVERAMALGWFLKRWKASEWMRSQEGYREKAAIAISSMSSRFDAIRFCNCRPGRRCGNEDFCPSCHYLSRIVPALAEYGDVFERAEHWLAAVPSVTYRSQDAGLHFVLRKDEEGRAKQYRHLRPFNGQPDLPGFSLEWGDADFLTRQLQVPFLFAQCMRQVGLADGAYATREIFLDFAPCPGAPGDWQVHETVIPHGNILFNSTTEPNWKFATLCWQLYVELWKRLGYFQLGYPDLVVGKAMIDQAEINRWLGYSLKPMHFEKFYRKGIKNGCLLDHLNMLFDQTVFMGIKYAFSGVRSPRKYGNLNCDPRNPTYIGRKPPKRTDQQTMHRIKRKIARMRKESPGNDPLENLTEEELDFYLHHDRDGRCVAHADRWSAEQEI